MSILFLSIDESVSSEVTFNHLDQTSLHTVDSNITELSSSIELESDVFESDSYIQHQLLEHIECEYYTTLAPIISIEAKSKSALVIPEGYLVEIDIKESESYIVWYVRQILDIHLPSMECFVSSIDMMHLCKIRLESIIFFVFS